MEHQHRRHKLQQPRRVDALWLRGRRPRERSSHVYRVDPTGLVATTTYNNTLNPARAIQAGISQTLQGLKKHALSIAIGVIVIAVAAVLLSDPAYALPGGGTVTLPRPRILDPDDILGNLGPEAAGKGMALLLAALALLAQEGVDIDIRPRSRERKSCASEKYKGYARCSNLYDYYMTSKKEVREDLSYIYDVDLRDVKIDKERDATRGPCNVYDYPDSQGKHFRVTIDLGRYQADTSAANCCCCDDTTGRVVLRKVWRHFDQER